MEGNQVAYMLVKNGPLLFSESIWIEDPSVVNHVVFVELIK